MYNINYEDWTDFLSDPEKLSKLYGSTENYTEEKDHIILNKETKTTIVKNVTGIEKKDLKVSLIEKNKDCYITIVGQTKDETTGKTYSVDETFAIDPTQLDLTTIKSFVKNGLLYITIFNKVLKENNKTTKIEIL